MTFKDQITIGRLERDPKFTVRVASYAAAEALAEALSGSPSDDLHSIALALRTSIAQGRGEIERQYVAASAKAAKAITAAQWAVIEFGAYGLTWGQASDALRAQRVHAAGPDGAPLCGSKAREYGAVTYRGRDDCEFIGDTRVVRREGHLATGPEIITWADALANAVLFWKDGKGYKAPKVSTLCEKCTVLAGDGRTTPEQREQAIVARDALRAAHEAAAVSHREYALR